MKLFDLIFIGDAVVNLIENHINDQETYNADYILSVLVNEYYKKQIKNAKP